MSGNVQSITKPEDLGEFFDFMFEDMDGYAYSPTKDPNTGTFEQYFFQWPTERKELIQHIIRHSPTREVYFSPGLYRKPESTKAAFKGTRFVWTEFDGVLPEHPEIMPDLKIKSSTDGHEHWYWRLDAWETDQQALELVTRRLAYHLGADMSVWNANKVLRPPFTMHHESNRMVHIIRWDHRYHALDDFRQFPEIPIPALQEEEIGNLPPVVKIVAKYEWKDDDFDFFMEENIPVGHRSSALTKLGHICIEMEMNNNEVLSILTHADNRWHKFSHRNDQKERLIGIINYVRSQHPVDVAEDTSVSRLKVYTYEEFINTEMDIEWVIPDLLHKKGMLSLSGPRDVGKSQMSLRFQEKLARGEGFLKWGNDKPIRTMFISMEMAHEELLYVMQSMGIEQDELLRENMLLMPIGGSIRLNSKIAQQQLNKVIEEFQPEGIFFDSFGKAVGKDLSSDEVIFETMDYIDEKIRREFGCFAWFIHHPRKAQVGNKKPSTADDLYGNVYYGNSVSTAVSLWPTGDGNIDVDCLKLRLAKKFNPFKVRRTSKLDFKVVTQPMSPNLGSGPDLPGGITI